VCARYPKTLIEEGGFVKLQEGIYEARILRSYRIRVIVVAELPLEEHNAMLLLFSAREKPLIYGQQHYRPHSRDLSSVLVRLLQTYSEDPEMSDKLKEFARETIDELLKNMSVEQRLKGLTVDEVIAGLSRMKGVPMDELIAGLPSDTLAAVARRLNSMNPPKQP
jgi:hypothetical protein